MPKLIDLVNNLRTFKYYYGGTGNFTQKTLGYGTGPEAEPYVRFPMPEYATKTQIDYYVGNRASLDFPGRGSSFQTLENGIIIPRAADYDAQRIQKFLKSNPKGYTFIAKQVGLQASNPKIEVGQQANLAAGNTTGRFYGMIENTRIYNGGVNTLTQVKLAGSGIHTDRHGTVPYNPYSVSYEKTVDKYNKEAEGTGNRLVMLLNNKMLGVNRIQANPSNPASPNNANYFSNLDNLQRLGIPKSNENLLFQYPGGPGSLYGLGVTTIRRYYNSDVTPNNNAKAFNYALLSDQNPVSQGGASIDFRQVLDPKFSTLEKIPSSSNLIPKGLNTALQTDTLKQSPQYPATNQAKTYNYGLLADIPDNRIFSKKGKTKDFRYTINSKISPNLALPTYDTPRSTRIPSDNTQPGEWGISTTFGTDTLSQNRITFTTVNEIESDGINKDPNNQAKAFNYSLLKQQKPVSQGGTFTDFREDLNSRGAKLETGSYTRQNMVNRIGISNAGSEVFQADKLNMLEPGDDYPAEISHNKDLVKLRFEAIEYGKEKPVPIIFRSYLTNLSDTHNGEISPFKYVGRGENFYTYTGFSRTISFGFKIAAESRQEMEPLYKRLKYLLSQVYPDYNDIGFMRAPVVRLTIGEYLYRQPGFITSLGITTQDNYPWEINIDGDKFEAPQILDISCQFTPIHDFLPRRSTGGKNGSNTPLIVPMYSTKAALR